MELTKVILDTPTPEPWHWYDAFGRKDGKGEPRGIGKGITGDEPAVGNCSRFSYAITDDQDFCIAHCTGALVTMSSERSEANAKLMHAAPGMLAVCEWIAAVLPEWITERDPDLEELCVMRDRLNAVIKKAKKGE